MRFSATHVYVSNAEDGTIGHYRMREDGSLAPGERFGAGGLVMPLALSPDRRRLYAALRSEPFTIVSYSIERPTGALHELGRAPLAQSLAYVHADATGRWLLGASYGGGLLSVNAIDAEGRAGPPSQVLPTGRNPHCIVPDRTNRWAFVPHLGEDEVRLFRFDAGSGTLAPNAPPAVALARGSGPRHIVTSKDNRLAFLLNELTGTVTSFSIDAGDGTLKALHSASILSADSQLRPGAPRPTAGRNVENDIWASDLHLTPDGAFLYAAERTSSTLGALRVERGSGRLHFLGSTPTEKQPRGFRIDPTGRFLVATGEKSETLSLYAIGSDGALELRGRCAAGPGANWVEIAAF